MIILENLDASYSPTRPCGLTIGSFDGVHLGHQKILRRVRDKVGGDTVCVLTFSNHPSHVLPGKNPTCLISSKEHKLELLEKYGVDVVYCIPFTLAFASKTYEEFLREFYQSCPFDFLVLGKNACIGKKREGTPEKVSALGNEMRFTAEYVEKETTSAASISSGKIRECILSGNLKKATELLGHSFVIEGNIQSQQLVTSYNNCLPPDGEYSVLINNTKKETLFIRKGKITMQMLTDDAKLRIAFC